MADGGLDRGSRCRAVPGPRRLKGLRTIGVDEFSNRKRHRYLTLVVDHERNRVECTGNGRGAEVLKKIFKLLGPEIRASADSVPVDLTESYTKATRDAAPKATIG